MTHSTAPTLWLQPTQAHAQPSAGCSACVATDSGPQCRGRPMVAACTQPLLVGPLEQLQAVMQALNREVIDPDTGRSVVDLQWVKSLRIENGESELTLTFEPACGAGKVMSEAAFHTLLRLQPDTDIYISHRS